MLKNAAFRPVRAMLMALLPALSGLAACGPRSEIQSFNPFGMLTGEPWIVVGDRELTPQERETARQRECQDQIGQFDSQFDKLNRACTDGPQPSTYIGCEDMKIHIVAYAERLLACPEAMPADRRRAQATINRYQAEVDRIQADNARRRAEAARRTPYYTAPSYGCLSSSGAITPGPCVGTSSGTLVPSPLPSPSGY